MSDPVSLPAIGDLQLTDRDEEALLARHRLERKANQAKSQALKKSGQALDKRGKRDLALKLAQMEADLDQLHLAELQQFRTQLLSSTEQNGDESVAATAAERVNNGAETTAIGGGGNGQQRGGEESKPAELEVRVSRAQKRRDKKSAESRQERENVAASVELSKTSASTLETDAIRKVLAARQLQLHTIPSDGDCLYQAIAHQLSVAGHPPQTVDSLRTLAADYIRTNRDSLIFYMCNPRTGECLSEAEFDDYCAAVHGSKAWGGQIEIKALSSALRVPIEVLQAAGPPTVQDEHSVGGTKLVLTYHRHMYSLGEHYNSTKRASGDVDDESDEAPASK